MSQCCLMMDASLCALPCLDKCNCLFRRPEDRRPSSGPTESDLNSNDIVTSDLFVATLFSLARTKSMQYETGSVPISLLSRSTHSISSNGVENRPEIQVDARAHTHTLARSFLTCRARPNSRRRRSVANERKERGEKIFFVKRKW